MNWYAIVRAGRFYNVEQRAWWVHAGDGTKFPDRIAAGKALRSAGLDPNTVDVVPVIEEGMIDGQDDPADSWEK